MSPTWFEEFKKFMLIVMGLEYDPFDVDHEQYKKVFEGAWDLAMHNAQESPLPGKRFDEVAGVWV